MNITHFKENKKKLKTIWKTIKEIINVKNNDVPINSLLIGETIITFAKLIANHLNTFFPSIAAKLNEKIVKGKKTIFTLFWTDYYLSFPQQLQQT